MAVLTPTTKEEVERAFERWPLGRVHRLDGLAAGSVNSNFRVVADGGEFFLRLYEEQDRSGALADTHRVAHLARAGVPTPAPAESDRGDRVATVAHKPAALFPWVTGDMRCQASIAAIHVEQVGAALASMHVASKGLEVGEGRFGPEALKGRLERIERDGGVVLAERVPALARALRDAESARASTVPLGEVPHGFVHGDVFRDNVLFDANDRLVALLDFESACRGPLVYDVMVAVLAFCTGDSLDLSLARRLVGGYESVRPFSATERAALYGEALFAAVRFTITRVTDYAMRQTDGPASKKDWKRFWARYEAVSTLGPDGFQEAVCSRVADPSSRPSPRR
jgi:homoserine kinase type II